MPKKRSGFWEVFEFILTSTGKGPIEIIKLFDRISLRPKEKFNNPLKKTPIKTSEIKKLKSNPVFNDFRVEKQISGNYSSFRKKLNEDSKIILIFGKRGSGKSALGLRAIENIKSKTNRSCYVLGINDIFLPTWIKSIKNIEETETGSVILVDESVVSFNARESMKGANKNLSKIMAIARHKNLTLLFITQNTGMIDKNILKLADSLIVKEGSLLQLEMERPEIKKFYIKSKKLLEKVKDEKIKYFYLIDSDFEGLLKHTLPSFWTDQISKNQV